MHGTWSLNNSLHLQILDPRLNSSIMLAQKGIDPEGTAVKL
jgi:hypothetical protein